MTEDGQPWGKQALEPEPEPLAPYDAPTVQSLLEQVRLGDVTQAAMLDGAYQDLPERKISARTCRAYDYIVGFHRGQQVHAAQFRDESGTVCCQHVRTPAKGFSWMNRQKGAKLQLFGQHLGSDGTVVVTEGELDAMSVAEFLSRGRFTGIQGQIVVVSIPDGVHSAAKALERQLRWLSSFTDVVLWFDQDEPGRAALKPCLDLLPKARYVDGFPYKDASDALQAGDGEAIKHALLNAKRHQPSYLVHATDLIEDMLNPSEDIDGHPLLFRGLNRLTGGARPGETWVIAAGTNIGKSQFSRALALDLAQKGQRTALLALEEDKFKTMAKLMSMAMGGDRPYHLETREQRLARDPQEQLDAAATFANDLLLLDRLEDETVAGFERAVKHYVLNEGCRHVFLDHFSWLADNVALATDQRRAIDQAIKRIAQLAKDMGFTFYIVSHLSRPAFGTPHEEGRRPELSDLRGSHSLAQVPDYVVMLQRNLMNEDPVERNITTVWVNKNRPSGQTGQACRLAYMPSSALHELPPSLQ